MVNGYPFSLGTSGYAVPLGGSDQIVIPGKMVIYNTAFIRVFLEFGNRCTVVRLGNNGGLSSSSSATKPIGSSATSGSEIHHPKEESSSTIKPTAGATATATATATAAGAASGGTKDVVVFNPMPWGPEARKLLQTLVPETLNKPSTEDISTLVNVKYIIAPDFEHHMALKGWKEQFPQARILGCEGLPEKKKKDGVPIDYVFTRSVSGRLITQESIAEDSELAQALPLPKDLTSEFDFVYVPDHPNKEIVALHKASKTLLTGDLVLNLPAYTQYRPYPHINPAGGWSFIARYLSIDSWLLKKLSETFPQSASPSLQVIYDWKPQTLIMAHGEIVTENATELFGNLFQKYLKKSA